jgi:hypothetical protein
MIQHDFSFVKRFRQSGSDNADLARLSFCKIIFPGIPCNLFVTVIIQFSLILHPAFTNIREGVSGKLQLAKGKAVVHVRVSLEKNNASRSAGKMIPLA